MARIKLDITGVILGSVIIPVRITDINYGNHLGNDAMVSILHEARVMFLANYGFTELNAGGAGLIMGDLAVEYLGECFYGDVLTINISAADITRASFDLMYSVETSRNGKFLSIARAKTGMVCYDYEKRKVMAVPAALVSVLNK